MGYHKLDVYNKAYKLALEIHQLSMTFPRHELYEIGSQLRRAAISVTLNIAEGYGRRNYVLDFRKFLINGMGSCNEVVVLLEMIKDLGYITEKNCALLKEQYDHLGRQLNKLIHLLQQEIAEKRKVSYKQKSE